MKCPGCPSHSSLGVGEKGKDNFRYHLRTYHPDSDAETLRRQERVARSLVSSASTVPPPGTPARHSRQRAKCRRRAAFRKARRHCRRTEARSRPAAAASGTQRERGRGEGQDWIWLPGRQLILHHLDVPALMMDGLIT